ncbi:MAG: DUF2493 domain-containing protein [Bacteroidetes bacterium]|nr:DUF2493 domain-containing protein [Bacteroidota bacterium]
MSYNLALIGSRNFTNKVLFDQILAEITTILGVPKRVISGGAIGADALAYEWANENFVEITIFEPKHKDFPKKTRKWMAPKERNTTIVENSDVVVAFWDMKSTGTKDTIEKALSRDLQLFIYNLSEDKLITSKDEILKYFVIKS